MNNTMTTISPSSIGTIRLSRLILLIVTILISSVVYVSLSSIASSPPNNNGIDQKQYTRHRHLQIRNSTAIFTTINRRTQEFHRPLILDSGFGTTGTKTLFKATCELQLRSVHYAKHCGFPSTSSSNEDGYKPSLGLSAHERVLLASMALSTCVSGSDDISRASCPTVREALTTMKAHLDAVIASPDIDVLHDSPYPEFTQYIIHATERIRGMKPILLLSERDPTTWTVSRMKHQHNLVCKLPESQIEGKSVPNNPGQNMQWCLETAMVQNMGDVPINEIFWSVSQMNENHEQDMEDIRTSIMEGGMALYQDYVRPQATYSVNLFEHDPFLTVSELAGEIEEALIPQMSELGLRSVSNDEFMDNGLVAIEKDKFHSLLNDWTMFWDGSS